jgi:hypothetical protein
MEQVEQLEIGFAILDYRVRKAIVVCHTLKERGEIVKLMADGFSIHFSSVTLTKPLLDQIGAFDTVKRAQYEIAQADATTPANITYSDENLASRSLAREEEANPRSQRSQSFYRVPINNQLLEEGVGATSNTGKLWIPKEIPFDSIREYASALLAKVSGTLNRMTNSNEIEAVLSTFNFDEMPELASADPLSFRESLGNLLRIVLLMLIHRQRERSYEVPFEIARYGVPRFFLHPRLRLVDPDTSEVGFWSDNAFHSPQVVLTGTKANPAITSYPGNVPLDTSELRHPITNSTIAIDNVLEALELIPNEQLMKIVRNGVAKVCDQIPKLQGVTNIIFRISGNMIILDVSRAYGDLSYQPTLISPSEVDELSPILQKQSVHPGKRSVIYEKLAHLGEKCVHMSDQNCDACIQDQENLCLRSLIGRYLKQTKILAHKGIELCDLTCRATVGAKQRRMWGFAKVASGKTDGGITLRNKPGAVLLAQIFGQIDKTTYNTVLVISPSPINQDFQDRAEVLCSAFGKEICILGADELGRLLLHFEEQAPFDGLNVDQIYKHSRTKDKRPKKVAAPVPRSR